MRYFWDSEGTVCRMEHDAVSSVSSGECAEFEEEVCEVKGISGEAGLLRDQEDLVSRMLFEDDTGAVGRGASEFGGVV